MLSAAASDRRGFVLGGTLLIGAGLAALRPRAAVVHDRTDIGALIPTTIGEYRFATMTGLVVPAPDETGQRIYSSVVLRGYVAPGAPMVMLAMAYGPAQDAGLSVHRPEACYPSAGYRIVRNDAVALSGVDRPAAARFLTATLDGRTEQIYYWTRIGRRFPVSAWGQRRALIDEGLRWRLPDAVLTRLSVVSDDRAGALAALERFNAAFLAALSPAGRRLLLGPLI